MLFLFPIVISTFFYIGFYNRLGEMEEGVIKVSFIEGEYYKPVTEYLDSLNQSQDEVLIEYSIHPQEEAKELLSLGVLDGFFSIEQDEYILYIKTEGAKESILKAYMDGYTNRGEEAGASAFTHNFVSSLEITSTDNTVIFFYAMAALACLLGANLGFLEISEFYNDSSYIGFRIRVSAIRQGSFFLSNLLALFTVQLLSIVLLLIYYIQVLKVFPVRNLTPLISICLAGSILGISLGMFINSFFHVNRTIKMGLLNVILFGGSILSWLMIVDLRYYIIRKIPAVVLLNPSGLITDAFYYLYHYKDYNKVYFNIIVLLLISALLFLLSIIARRNSYDHNKIIF